MIKRISIDPGVRSGKPCVKGTRITVGDVLGWFAAGMTESEVLSDYPELTSDDVRACFEFAARRERTSVVLSRPA